MDGLRTTRVLVVDTGEEAAGIVNALAREGIGSVCYSHEESLLPEQPLHGIRLAALDMDLQEVGSSEVSAVIGPTLSVLQRILGKDNGPYLAIAWTKHPNFVEAFRERAAELPSPPVSVIPLLKAEAKDADGSFNFAKIAAEVQKALDESYPLGLLAFWEQMVHKSSGSIMEMMLDGNSWTDGSKKTLALLLRHSAGEDDSQDVKLRALLETFNSLQFDAIESDTALLSTETANSLVYSPEIGGTPSGDPALAARLNRRLLFGVALPDVASGNVYQPETIVAAEKDSFPTVDELLDDMAQPGKQQELKEAGSLAVAMEITPVCDYQQGKVRRARFVCGIAVAPERSSLIKRGDFVRHTPVVWFDNEPLSGNRIMVWNSHFIISVPPKQVPQGKALVRLRQSPLMDVQAWVGSHATRPGYLSVQQAMKALVEKTTRRAYLRIPLLEGSEWKKSSRSSDRLNPPN